MFYNHLQHLNQSFLHTLPRGSDLQQPSTDSSQFPYYRSILDCSNLFTYLYCSSIASDFPNHFDSTGSVRNTTNKIVNTETLTTVNTKTATVSNTEL